MGRDVVLKFESVVELLMDIVISASFSFVSAVSNQEGTRERGLTSNQRGCKFEENQSLKQEERRWRSNRGSKISIICKRRAIR